MFPSSRLQFTKRFAAQVVKLVYFEIQGIKVSDIFITNCIEKNFSEEFLELLELGE
jgi:hypothetical protein